MARQVIEQKLVAGLTVTDACQFLGVSRQAYYQYWARATQANERHRKVLSFVIRERALQPRLGVRKLHYLMTKARIDYVPGRDKLFALLRENRLLVPAKKAYHKTTHSHHRFRCHPNLLKSGEGQVQVKRPEQLWVADITYLPVVHGEAYLSLVTDAFSRKIVGYHVHDTLRADAVSRAFSKALKHRQWPMKPLIHHSDRGIQYCSGLYQAIHQKHGVRCSMTDGYDCYQNAQAERVNGILKNEYLLQKPKDLGEASIMVQQSIELYNKRRPHMALKYKTPDAMHRAFT